MIAQTPDADPRELEREQKAFWRRFLVVKLGFSLVFVAVVVRLVTIQVVESPKYKALARKQYEQKFVLPAIRGTVSDRNGTVLVSNTMMVSFAADPRIVGENANEVAAAFSRIFGVPKSSYLARLSEPRRFVWLERRTHPDLARKVEAERLPGIVIMNEPKRLYPYDDLAGALLGFTNIDNVGISGIELELNAAMRGEDGMVVMQRDGFGRVRPSADYPRREPVNGSSVALTIDLAYQAIADEELRKGIEANKAEGGLAVLLNPKTGEVLAMSVFPCINPNDYAHCDAALARNRIVSDLFEPGSVFKLVTATAAFENNVVQPDTRISAEHGKMKVPLGGNKFRFITDSHEMDMLTFQEGIELSSNIVMAKVGKLIGPGRLFEKARAFGFGTPTGIDVPGEVRGVLKRPFDWSGTTLQSMSFGYEVGVTPLQIACAYAALANHGVLMKPYVVAEVRDESGRVVEKASPQPVRRVTNDATVNLLTAALEGTVERGTALEARVHGVRIAGKTGTSRKIVNGKYSTTDFTASFVGYLPVEDPQVVCLVMMDNPRGRSYYGGATSAPVFRGIAERVIQTSARYTSAPPVANVAQQNGGLVVPDVRTLQPALARKIVENRGFTCRVFGKGIIVVKQSPEPGAKIERGDVVTLLLTDGAPPLANGMIVVPDLRGLSLRRAVNRLVADDFDVQIHGSGIVSSQQPAAGQKVQAGSTVTIIGTPRPIAQASFN